MRSHLSSLGILELRTIRDTVTQTCAWHRFSEEDMVKEENLPPQTGQPLSDPPWATRGSSMLCKNGGTLNTRQESAVTQRNKKTSTYF